MRQKWARSFAAAAALYIAAAMMAGPARAADLAREHVLVVGRVSDSPSRHMPRVQAFADWLSKRLAPAGIRAGKSMIAASRAEMADLLRAGKVDLVEESVLSALFYEEAAGARIIAIEWRRGRRQYRTYFVTRADGPVRTLADLSGRRIALEDAGSTTSFFLPLAVLLENGLKPVRLSAGDSPVPPGHVGYVFTQSELNVSAWVVKGLVEAGAYSDGDWRSDRTNPPRFRNRLRVFHKTAPLVRSTLAVRAGLRPGLERAIARALADYAESPEAAEVRARYYGVTRFEKIEGAAAHDLDAARRIYRAVRPLIQ